MQDLHLVGYTTDRRHLIFSARRGAKSGGFLVPVDDGLLSAIDELSAAVEDEDDLAEEPQAPPTAPRVESRLSVREVQARLRAGDDVDRVAADAGVDPEWVERFAPPVRAEQRQMVERALRMRMERPRAGLSSVPLRRAVAAAMAERGVSFTAESFDRAWSARLVGADRWVVEFRYDHRGQSRTATWTVDADGGALTTTDRTASQLGFVAEDERVPPESETIRSALTTTVASALPGAQEPAVREEASARGRTPSRTAKTKAAKQRKAAPTKKAARKTAKKKAARKKAAPARKPRAVKKRAAPAKKTARKKAVQKRAVGKRPAPAKKARTAKKKAAPARRKAAKKKKAAPPRKKAAKKKAAPAPKGRAVKKRAAPAKKTAEPQAAPQPEAAATQPAPPERRGPDPARPDSPAGDDRPVVRLRAPEPTATPAPPGGARPADRQSAARAEGSRSRVEARRARPGERPTPTVQFRSGRATPVRDVPGGPVVADRPPAATPDRPAATPDRPAATPDRPAAADPIGANGRAGGGAGRTRRTRQLRAR